LLKSTPDFINSISSFQSEKFQGPNVSIPSDIRCEDVVGWQKGNVNIQWIPKSIFSVELISTPLKVQVSILKAYRQ
jgi:hypothetical protein